MASNSKQQLFFKHAVEYLIERWRRNKKFKRYINIVNNINRMYFNTIRHAGTQTSTDVWWLTCSRQRVLFNLNYCYENEKWSVNIWTVWKKQSMYRMRMERSSEMWKNQRNVY